MILNIYSNRTYNDLSQYHVFTWIYINYNNENFDIINSNLRLLNSPMGMLEINKESLERKKTYFTNLELFEKYENDYKRYESHYSTPLYITYYLLRIFPFAFDKIEIQVHILITQIEYLIQF